MKTLLILNDAPYGSERTYNGLRLAGSLSRQENTQLKVFLIGDAVAAAKSGQKVPSGYYNAATMVGSVVRHGGSVGVCGSCIDARGIGEGELVEGAHRSSMDELTAWTLEADKVLVF
jgi:uncharacterized protein involved in oxidation of intracellular sulfur